jgi:hypothetical protein
VQATVAAFQAPALDQVAPARRRPVVSSKT